MRVCESLMKREPPMPHDFAHDGMESRDWRMLAACLDEDPELFFPTGTTLSAKMQAAVAREVCTQCIVRDECRDWAMDTRQDHGVWGWPGRVRTSLLAAARTQQETSGAGRQRSLS